MFFKSRSFGVAYNPITSRKYLELEVFNAFISENEAYGRLAAGMYTPRTRPDLEFTVDN